MSNYKQAFEVESRKTGAQQIVIGNLREKIKTLTAEGAAIRAVVDEQAEDEGLWFVGRTAPEDYLQAALRRLHEVIEGKTGDEVARDLVSTQLNSGENDG